MSQSHLFSLENQNVSSSSLPKTSCHGNILMFPCSQLLNKKTPKTKVLLQKLILGCTLLSWFEIKPVSPISNQLQLKRFATSMMSFYMTSLALFIQMPLDGLWSEKQTNSSDDYVILHEKFHPNNRADLHGLYVYFGPKLPRLLPITCACYGPGWDTKFPHPLSSSCDFFTHKLCIPGRNDLKFHVGIS